MTDKTSLPPGPGPRLLDLIACPVSRGPLRFDRDRQELASPHAKLAFPLKDGVPLLVAEKSHSLD